MNYSFRTLGDYMTEIKKKGGLVLKEGDEVFVTYNANKLFLDHMFHPNIPDLTLYVLYTDDEGIYYSFKE